MTRDIVSKKINNDGPTALSQTDRALVQLDKSIDFLSEVINRIEPRLKRVLVPEESSKPEAKLSKETEHFDIDLAGEIYGFSERICDRANVLNHILNRIEL